MLQLSPLPSSLRQEGAQVELQGLLRETEPEAGVLQVDNLCQYLRISGQRTSCRGVAAHCRKHVQDLNMKRGQLYEESLGKTEPDEEEEEPDYGDLPPAVADIGGMEEKPRHDVNSRWYKYI